jgi:SAM-dependent methyltransferase
MRGSTRSSEGRAIRTDLSSSPYGAFARFYDAFTAASDYEHWTGQVLAAAAPHGPVGDRLLDVACGTGRSFLPFLRRGHRVTGCDGSPEMLAEASLKAPGADLRVCDMRALPELGSFDLVTCFDDSLNYLADGDELLACFRGVADNLAPRGLFAFDLNTLRAYRTTFACDSVTEAGGNVFAWRGESSPDFAEGDATAAAIEIFAPAGDGLYERVVTRHEQRHHPVSEVTALLDEAGLRLAALHGTLDDGRLVDTPDESTHLKVLYIARHREGGGGQ